MDAAESNALALMRAFADRTGLDRPGRDAGRPPRRYLWTDAFATCNFIGLAAVAPECAALATRLVDQVHRVLGRHRPDDARSGWLSGLDEAQGAAHPTRGGLRIGKPLPERGAGDAHDPELEWERDGQYFHYLTRWMHALDQYARRGGHPAAQRWARELAEAAHRGFVHAQSRGAPPRMAWKMSIDLRRVLVSSQGQHDPLDGLVTYLQLRAHRDPAQGGPDLGRELREITQLVAGGVHATDDPLGIGGLLADAWRLHQLLPHDSGAAPLMDAVLEAAAVGLRALARQRLLEGPAGQRLPFRELGLAIGLVAATRVRAAGVDEAEADPRRHRLIGELATHAPMAEAITAFWSVPAHQQAGTWRDHEDINAVMLATALAPGGYLDF